MNTQKRRCGAEVLRAAMTVPLIARPMRGFGWHERRIRRLPPKVPSPAVASGIEKCARNNGHLSRFLTGGPFPPRSHRYSAASTPENLYRMGLLLSECPSTAILSAGQSRPANATAMKIHSSLDRGRNSSE